MGLDFKSKAAERDTQATLQSKQVEFFDSEGCFYHWAWEARTGGWSRSRSLLVNRGFPYKWLSGKNKTSRKSGFGPAFKTFLKVG